MTDLVFLFLLFSSRIACPFSNRLNAQENNNWLEKKKGKLVKLLIELDLEMV